MVREIWLKLKPSAIRTRAFSVSVASMSALRSASSSAERPDRVSSKNIGDFGTAAWSFLAIFKIFSASLINVGVSLSGTAIALKVWTLLMKGNDVIGMRRSKSASTFQVTHPSQVLRRLFRITLGEYFLAIKERPYGCTDAGCKIDTVSTACMTMCSSGVSDMCERDATCKTWAPANDWLCKRSMFFLNLFHQELSTWRRLDLRPSRV